MTMTILITSCVWVTFFTILNQFEQKHYLALQEQRDELRDLLGDILKFQVKNDWLLLPIWARVSDTLKRTGGAK